MFAVGTGGMSVIAFEMETWPGGRQAGRQAGSSVFTYSISKIQRTTSTLGLAVSSGI